MGGMGRVTSTPLSLLPTSLYQLRSRHWAPSTVRVASSCWNLVVVELWCPAIQDRLFSCFNDCQYTSSALTPSLITHIIVGMDASLNKRISCHAVAYRGTFSTH